MSITKEDEEKFRKGVELWTKEAKKFFRGKKWNKKQREELDKQGSPPLELNRLPKVCKSFMSNVNQFSFAEMEAMNKAEIAEKLALNPFCGENENLKGGMEVFGVMTKDFFRLQRISNLERSLLLLTLGSKAEHKRLEEEIERLRRGGE